MAERTIKLEIVVDDKGTPTIRQFGGASKREFEKSEKGAKDLNRELDKTTSSLGKLKLAAGGIVAAFGFAKIFGEIKEWVSEAGKAQEANAGLLQAMKSMGRYTPGLHKGLMDVASGLQQVTTFEDDSIIAGQKLLITFKSITDDMLPQTTEAMVDLAAMMGGDTVQAAIMLGKASMGMTEQLRRVGITVDEATFKSQGFIGVLRQVIEQVGGQGRAQAQTGIGAWKQLANIWGDAKEDLGTMVLEISKGLIPVLKEMIPLVTEAAQGFSLLFGLGEKNRLQKELHEINTALARNEYERKNIETDVFLRDPRAKKARQAQLEQEENELRYREQLVRAQMHELEKPPKPVLKPVAPGPAGMSKEQQEMLDKDYKYYIEQYSRVLNAADAFYGDLDVSREESLEALKKIKKEEWDLIDKNLEYYSGQYSRQIEAAEAFYGDIGEAAKEANQYIAEDTKKTFGDEMMSAIRGWGADFSKTLRDMVWGSERTFGSIAIAFGKMLTQMALQKTIVEPLLSWGLSFFKSEHGNVFSGGQIIPMASGGIIDRPVIFPLARGAGIAGEAGPEAILPLKRTSSGDLGVMAAGDKSKGQGGITIVMNNPVFQDLETQRQVFEQMAAVIASRVAPISVMRAINNDYPIRDFFRGLR